MFEGLLTSCHKVLNFNVKHTLHGKVCVCVCMWLCTVCVCVYVVVYCVCVCVCVCVCTLLKLYLLSRVSGFSLEWGLEQKLFSSRTASSGFFWCRLRRPRQLICWGVFLFCGTVSIPEGETRLLSIGLPPLGGQGQEPDKQQSVKGFTDLLKDTSTGWMLA